jgi:hypothetical protein
MELDMSSTHYILAKHVPDVFRKEPKNIGVIVWSEVGVASQFWGVDAHGVVDKREVPPFINSASAYEQWVHFWLKEIADQKVEFIGSGKFATINSPEFVQAIQTGNSDNFFLQESGVVFESITKDDLPKLAKELFESLVTSQEIDEPDTSALVKTECEKVVRATKLASNKYFLKGVSIHPTVRVGAFEKVLSLDFSYAYKNGSIKWLGQQVALKRYPSQLAKEVQSVCYKFERAFEAEFVTRSFATSFIYPMEDQQSDSAVVDAIGLLSAYSNVIDLRNTDSAKREFDRVADISVVGH